MLVIKQLDEYYQESLIEGLTQYDIAQTHVDHNKKISYGYFIDDLLVGGITAKIEGFNVLYVETLFVIEEYRKLKIGSKLLETLEDYARFEGVLIIRLDTFSWQAKGFYEKMGYELIGSYQIKEGFSEYFFLKRL